MLMFFLHRSMREFMLLFFISSNASHLIIEAVGNVRLTMFMMCFCLQAKEMERMCGGVP